MNEPRAIALQLLQATALPDEQVYTGLSEPKYTTVDYYRMACHLLFECQRCGTCCTTGDPIRLRHEDAALLARHLKIPLSKAIKKYTVPDPDRPGALDFKHILPCKFYDARKKAAKSTLLAPGHAASFPSWGSTVQRTGSWSKSPVRDRCRP